MNINKIVASTSLAIGLISVMAAFLLYNGKSRLDHQLTIEKVRFDSLAGANLYLKNSLFEKSEDISRREEKIREINKVIDDLRSSIKTKQDQIGQLQRAQARHKLESVELADLKNKHSDLEKQLATSNQSTADLQNEKDELLNSIEKLKMDNYLMSVELKNSSMVPELVRLESVRGNQDKIVVRARRVQRIKIIFNTTSEVQDLEYKITSPTDAILPTGKTDLVSKVIDQNVKVSEKSHAYKKIEMVYNSPKLASGIYTVEVLSKGIRVASMQIRLR